METGSSPSPDEFSSYGVYVRLPVGRQPPCRLDATADGRCRLIVLDKSGREKTVFDVPVVEVEHARLRVGQLTIVAGGRDHHVTLATPNAAARLGMTTISLSAFRQAAGGGAATGVGMLAGSAVAGWGMARREKQVDAEGLRWLRLFADHGVDVEAPQRWKPRVRYALMGVTLLLTVVSLFGSIITVAEEGGWTAQAQRGVIGLAVFVVLTWVLYWAAIWLLWKTVPRDTERRLRAAPDQLPGTDPPGG